MDALDKLSIAVLIVLVAALVVLGMDYQGKAAGDIERATKLKMNMAGISEIPSGTIKTLKDLIASDNIKKAEVLANDLLKKYPYDGEPHFLMGDIMMHKQNPVSALYSNPMYCSCYDLFKKGSCLSQPRIHHRPFVLDLQPCILFFI